MKILIVYDSVFSNTKQIAQAMHNALLEGNNVQITSVNDFKNDMLKGVELLVMGSPTRAFRPTPAMVNIIKNLSDNSLSGVKIAAFDTRVDLEIIKNKPFRWLVKTAGWAADVISKKLVTKGANEIIKPEGFLVMGEKGPLKEGEIIRAAKWAKEAISR